MRKTSTYHACDSSTEIYVTFMQPALKAEHIKCMVSKFFLTFLRNAFCASRNIVTSGEGGDWRERDVTRGRWRHRAWRHGNVCVATQRQSTGSSAAGRNPYEPDSGQRRPRRTDEVASDGHHGYSGLPRCENDPTGLCLCDVRLAVSAAFGTWSPALEMCLALVSCDV